MSDTSTPTLFVSRKVQVMLVLLSLSLRLASIVSISPLTLQMWSNYRVKKGNPRSQQAYRCTCATCVCESVDNVCAGLIKLFFVFFLYLISWSVIRWAEFMLVIFHCHCRDAVRNLGGKFRYTRFCSHLHV